MSQPANEQDATLSLGEINCQQFVDLSHDAAMIVHDMHIIALNDACMLLLDGTERTPLLGVSVLTLIDANWHESFVEQIRKTSSVKVFIPTTAIGLRSVAGNLVLATYRSSPIDIPGKTPAVLLSIRSDRESQQGIDDLRGATVPLRTILETAMDGIISINENQEIVLFNSAAEQIFGWTAEQVLGRPIDLLIPDRFRTHHRHDVEQFGKERVENRRMGEQRTVLALRSSGEEFPIEASISKTTVNSSKVYTVILRDVTQVVRYSQKIEEQSQMLDHVSDAISVVDVNGRITYWNQAAVHLFGWSVEQALGQSHRDLLYRGEVPFFNAMIEETDRRGSWAGELVKATKENASIIVEHRRSVVRDTSGNPNGYLCIDIDITERKKRDIVARRSQRLESIGTLAGGIAHDLNNVLTPILMGAKLLASGRSSGNHQAILDTLMASAHRGTDLVKQVLAFAGGLHGERGPVEMKPLIAETHQLLEHTLPKSVKIETWVDPSCPRVSGDATELSQILMNLCINARDAMPVGGTLSINAEGIYISSNATQLNPAAHQGLYVILKVADTGSGMTPEVLDRIFDPFFTTKETGKGTGLGLATVQGIVKSYNGFVNVYSEPNRGTTFSVYIPALVDERQVKTSQPDVVDETVPGELILLVDDETFILQMTSAALEANGYRVITTKDGAEALAIFSKRNTEISAVLLDMMMPGLDGLEVLDELLKIDRNAIVIACSGLRTSQREAEVKERGAREFLPKPYSEEQLFHALAKVLKR